MKKTVKILMLCAAAVLTACGGDKYHVEGELKDAKDSVLYFEHVGLSGIEEVGRTTLDKEGQFEFSGDAPDAPDFFRLRIGDQIINIAIDTAETVSVKARYPQMSTIYEVSGSDDNQKIKELALRQIDLQERVLALEGSGSLLEPELRDSLQRMLYTYKEDVKRDYIFPAPYKSYAYFALFQTLGPWLIFDPKSNADDVRVFGAVATSWDTFYPGAERGENLHNIAIEGMKNVRIVESRRQAQAQAVDENKIVESGIIEIQLPDNHGRQQRLTSLKGKVVLLDFHMFGLADSPQRILSLREYYNKYHAQGLEIFQVAFDRDEHFWKQMTDALPWICVRDAESINSPLFVSYNIPSLPEFFLIDRQNNLVKRSSQMKDLDAEIRALL